MDHGVRIRGVVAGCECTFDDLESTALHKEKKLVGAEPQSLIVRMEASAPIVLKRAAADPQATGLEHGMGGLRRSDDIAGCVNIKAGDDCVPLLRLTRQFAELSKVASNDALAALWSRALLLGEGERGGIRDSDRAGKMLSCASVGWASPDLKGEWADRDGSIVGQAVQEKEPGREQHTYRTLDAQDIVAECAQIPVEATEPCAWHEHALASWRKILCECSYTFAKALVTLDLTFLAPFSMDLDEER